MRKADRKASLTAAENSFETVARKWWAHWKPARTEQHAGQVMRRFEANVFPYIGGPTRVRDPGPRIGGDAQGNRSARRQ
jgi:hypothetical protein